MHNPSPIIATVNSVPLHTLAEVLPPAALRQRACTELLRQAAIARGLLDPADPATSDSPTSAAADAIDKLLEHELRIPEPNEEACRRYHAAHRSRYAVGERVQARHVLFAVMPGVNVEALRQRAEACLIDLRCDVAAHGERFASAARELSNCPSGAAGGELGWLSADACAPELARALFGQAHTGVMPQLVTSRFGFHVVDVQAREPGSSPPFETVRAAVLQALRQQAFVTAVQQYVRVLAGHADLRGVALGGLDTPLVQ